MGFGEFLGLWTHPQVWGDAHQFHRDRSSSTWDFSRHHPTHLFIWLFIHILCHEPVSPKGNQSRVFIGRTDAEAPILWPPDMKSQLTGKDPDVGKDWCQEEKGQQRMRWLGDIINTMDMSLSKLQKIVKDKGAWCAAVQRVTKSQTWLWTRRNKF